MDRRSFLLSSAALGLGMASQASAQTAACASDGTPLQFIPKTPKDANPTDNDIGKYAKCPYCAMDRKEYHFSRHLIHYSDDLVDGTCSIRCAAVSLSVNLDRNPKAIYAADNASDAEIKPLVLVDKAFYVIGGGLRAVMSKVAKTAFSDKAKAEAVIAKEKGEIVGFDQALTMTYNSLAEDTMRTRARREEKRKKMMEQKG